MKLHIVKISDGKAGHITTTDGVIDAIKRNCQIKTTLVTVKLRVKFFIPLLKYIVRNQWLCGQVQKRDMFLSFFYRGVAKLPKSADIIVSSGGDTAFLNIWLSKRLNAKNIYCSSLRGVSPEHFSLIVGTEDTGISNAVILEMAPVKMDMSGISDKIELFCKEKGISTKGKYYVLLIGGNGAGYEYRINDLTLLVEKFMHKVEQDHAKALITTSRRTGEENERLLETLFAKYKADIAYEVYFGKDPEKVVAGFLSLSSAVFVTEESGSMITEAVLSKKPVFTICPANVKEQKKYKAFLDRLFSKKRIMQLKLEEDWDHIDMDEKYFTYIDKVPVEILAEKLQLFLKDIKACE
jgi:mitochondrial fission protein ELM1